MRRFVYWIGLAIIVVALWAGPKAVLGFLKDIYYAVVK
jgi:hypothetical protein